MTVRVEHALCSSTHEISAAAAGLLIGYASPEPDTGVVTIHVIDTLHLPEDGWLAQAEPVISGMLPGGLAFVGVHLPSAQNAAIHLSKPSVRSLLQHSGLDGLYGGKRLVGVWSRGHAGAEYTLHGANGDVIDPQLHVDVNIAPPGPASPWRWDSPRILCSADIALPLDVFVVQPAAGEVEGAALEDAITVAQQEAESALGQSPSGQAPAFLAQARGNRAPILLLPAADGGSDDGPSLQEACGAGSELHDDQQLTVQLTAQPMRVPPSSAPGPGRAPVYRYQVSALGALTHTRVMLYLSALVAVPAATPLPAVGPSWLLPALRRQLRAAARLLVDRPAGLTDVRARHYLPPGRSHPITLLYPEPLPGGAPAGGHDAWEAALMPLRRCLHRALHLPLDRPLLRAANAVPLGAADGMPPSDAPPARLRDVHAGLQPPVPGGTLSLVDGSYEYWHYMQDRFNDAGWGCAYRSLQTLVSWFRLQHYTAKPVPSHREVQALLVKLGDKAADFIGSSQWIGAIELSYILDEYLDVTSKIITVNRGADIPSHARPLAAHFDSQGTPIMIGGGVLAYTLLGVAFDEASGDCAFLILDPHYTGGEDLRKIHGGAWVGWKKPGDTAAAGGPLFMPDAFYNFLCPQRPKQV